MSRKIFLSEYGPKEPISFRKNDLAYSMLSLRKSRDRNNISTIREILTSSITIALDDALAHYVARNSSQCGMHIFKWHKETMCRYVHAAVRHGAQAYKAIRDFYQSHDIDEDDYQMETAWKVYQRWCWKREDKNKSFSTQKRGTKAVFLSEKNKPKQSTVSCSAWTMKDIEIELSAARFIAMIEQVYKRHPKRLAHHVRIYLYIVHGGLSSREVARKLGVKQWSAAYARRTIEQQAKTNPTLRACLFESIALPQR